jgi:hypothetical protein
MVWDDNDTLNVSIPVTVDTARSMVLLQPVHTIGVVTLK